MSEGKEADIYHGFPQGGFDDTVAHTNYEEEKEGKRVAPGVEDRDYDHHDFCQRVRTMAILIVIKAPCHQLFDNEEQDDGCDVILHWKDVVSILYVKKSPENAYDGVNDCDTCIEREFGNLGSGELAISVTKLNRPPKIGI